MVAVDPAIDVLGTVDHVIVRVQLEIDALLLVKEKGDVAGIKVVRVSQKNVVARQQGLRAV
jgi:hypothetical protein